MPRVSLLFSPNPTVSLIFMSVFADDSPLYYLVAENNLL